MKSKHQIKTCPEGLSNECVVWQGGDVPVLGIYDGSSLDITEYILATKIVELFGDIDMSKVDMSCLQATAAQNCKDTSLKAIIQVLFDNQCSLATLINSAVSAPQPVTVTVNMKCLTVYDDFGNVVPQDLNQTLQSLINQVCTSATDILGLKSSVTLLQTQVAAIPTTVTAPPEPTITTCLTPALRPVSQTVPLVAQALCDFQTAFGNASDASIAVSQQCANLNTTFAGTQGWLTSVNSLAQSINNLWILACNLNTRLTVIETNCCQLTCKDIALGFTVQVDQNGTGVYLKFTAGAGTSIPNGFVDAGSSVTFTDKNGQYLTYPLVIANNATLGDFDLTGLDLTDPITIAVTSVLSTSGLTCEQCITKLYTIGNNTCPVCQVTASGTTGQVTIAYTVLGSSTVNTLVLQPKQIGYIPTNAVIVAVTSTGDTTASSTCINLTPPPTVCYVFKYEHSGSPSGGGGAYPLSDAAFTRIFAGNLSYKLLNQISPLVPTTSNPPYYSTLSPLPFVGSGANMIASINASNPGVIQGMCAIVDTTSNTTISVQLPQTLGIPQLEIGIYTGGPPGTYTDYMYLTGTLSTNGTDCSCNNTGGGGISA